jgi:hypothetical protein
MWLQNQNPDWSLHTPWWGLIRRKLMAVFVAYRPERHYMRGPGPKWREKHARSSAEQHG